MQAQKQQLSKENKDLQCPALKNNDFKEVSVAQATSFPGSLFFPSPGARERERETGLSLSLAPGDGKKRDPGS